MNKKKNIIKKEINISTIHTIDVFFFFTNKWLNRIDILQPDKEHWVHI